MRIALVYSHQVNAKATSLYWFFGIFRVNSKKQQAVRDSCKLYLASLVHTVIYNTIRTRRQVASDIPRVYLNWVQYPVKWQAIRHIICSVGPNHVKVKSDNANKWVLYVVAVSHTYRDDISDGYSIPGWNIHHLLSALWIGVKLMFSLQI